MCLCILRPVPFLPLHPSADGESFIPKFSHYFISSLNLTQSPSHFSSSVSTSSTLGTSQSSQITADKGDLPEAKVIVCPLPSAEPLSGFSSPSSIGP